MIKAVFFDVGNTLIKDDPSVPYVFASVAQRMGFSVDLEALLPFMKEVNAFYEQSYLTDGDFWCDHDRAVQLWLDMYTMMAHFCGITKEAKEVAWQVYREYLLPDNWSFFPDAENCLHQLKQTGYRLALVSNWDATLEELIRSLGKLMLFDEVISSASVGCRKPNAAIFHIALERMQLCSDEVIHVGDLPEADGQGASSAGITPVIIDRYNKHLDCGYRRISSLDLLPDLLSQLV